MKKLILLLLLLPGINFAQETTTTEEEYNYLTEGIKDQVKKGLDIGKAGYSIDKIYDVKSMNGNSIYTFNKFLDSKNQIKAILITVKSPEATNFTGGMTYCYPINNPKLFKKFTKSVHQNLQDDNILNATNEVMIYLLNK